MASYADSGTVEVKLRGDWWVRVRHRLTQGQYNIAQAYLTNTELVTVPKPGTDEFTIRLVAKPDVLGHEIALVAVSIIDWNLTDEAGNVLPLDDAHRFDSVRKMDREDFATVLDAVNKLNEPRSADDQVAFRDGSDAGVTLGVGASTGAASEVPDGAGVLAAVGDSDGPLSSG